MSRHRVTDGFRRIGDNDAQFCGFGDGNVVRAASGAKDHAAALQDIEILGVDTLMTAEYPDNIGITADFGQFFARPTLPEYERDPGLFQRGSDPFRDAIGVHSHQSNFEWHFLKWACIKLVVDYGTAVSLLGQALVIGDVQRAPPGPVHPPKHS